MLSDIFNLQEEKNEKNEEIYFALHNSRYVFCFAFFFIGLRG